MGNRKWITLLFCIITELCIYGQKKGDFTANQSIYFLTSQPNQSNFYKMIIYDPFYSLFFENEIFISGGQIDLGFTYYMINNIGFILEGGWYKTRHKQKGMEANDYGGRYNVNFIQDYTFSKIGFGLNGVLPVSDKIECTAKYIYNYLYHHDNYDSYLIVLKKYHFQHSLKLGFIFNDNSALKFGCEFIATQSSENMVSKYIEKEILIKPLNFGVGFVMSYSLKNLF